MSELLAYLLAHPPKGFKPVPFHNKDGNQIEWYWKNDHAYSESVLHDGKWVGSIHKSMETDEVVGVTIHLEAAGVTP